METYIMKSVEGFPARKISDVKDYDITPCDVIFKYVEKPKDYLMCKSINVYDDRWRVNVYSKRYVHDIEGRYISQSYFVHFNKATGHVSFVSPKIQSSPQC
jgi:hypothetical protein